MKIPRNTIKRLFSSMMIPAIALLAAAGAGRANVVIGTFNSAADVSGYVFQGWNGSSGGVAAFSTNAPSGGLSSGSMQLQIPFSSSEQGGSFLSTAAAVDVSAATNLEFDVMVDPASPVDPNGNAFYFQIGFNSPSYDNINPFWLGPWGKNFTPGVWQHVTIAVPPGSLGANESEFFIYPYDGNYTTAETPIFYVDNIVFDTVSANAPGPKVSVSKPAAGLNVFASTTGVYDRQSARLMQNTGKGWVGHATAANPVTYSFTLSGFPNVPAYSTEAYMFLVPNPVANDNAPDYNEADCVIAEVQSSSSGSLLSVQYKVNEVDGNGMYYNTPPYTNALGSWNGTTTPWYESGILGNVSSTVLNGTYTLKFTSNSNLTLIAPDGSSTNLVIPAYNAGDFAETSGFSIYLGMQANNAAAFGQAVAFSSFSVSNTVTPFSDNFLADTTLNTNYWDPSVAAGPAGVFVVPATAADLLSWTAPAVGYSLETGTNLLNLSNWTSPTRYPVVAYSGGFQQLVDKSELPGGGIGFFNLVHRVATQLQVLLPGETNAPGTVTGKVGTPAPVGLYDDVTITVNAVDQNFNIVSSSDQVQITSSDSGFIIDANPIDLSGGTATDVINFATSGSQTVTATDNTNSKIAAGTSSPVTVQ